MYDLDLTQQIQMISKKIDKFGWNHFHHKQRGNDFDALPSSLINSNVSLKWKQWKSKELGHTP
jgi:hypothetical protein